MDCWAAQRPASQLFSSGLRDQERRVCVGVSMTTLICGEVRLCISFFFPL